RILSLAFRYLYRGKAGLRQNWGKTGKEEQTQGRIKKNFDGLNEHKNLIWAIKDKINCYGE
nr:hypothetical protein [Candidatus Omnitrophota bacterium]